MRRASLARGTCSRIFEIAEAVGARVLLVGDRRQTRSVTAGEPLRLLEERAGLKVAKVDEIVRQQGDYKKAAKALSEGRTGEAIAELDKLGWIKEVADEERYQLLADEYLAAAAEKRRDGSPKTLLIVSPMHAEANRITEAIRDGLKARGKLGKERVVNAWISPHLTDAEKSDPTQYDAGDLDSVPSERERLREGRSHHRGRRHDAADGSGESV